MELAQEVSSPPSLFYVQNGVLAVENAEDLDDVLYLFKENSFSQAQRTALTGFISLSSAYQDFLSYSSSVSEQGYGMPIQAVRNKYAKIIQMEDDGTFTINCALPYMAPPLNTDGLIKVGNALWLFRYDRIACISDGDTNKISLAMRLRSDDLSHGVYVQLYDPGSAPERAVCVSPLATSSGLPAVTAIAVRDWGRADRCDAPGSPQKFRLKSTVYNSQNSAIEGVFVEVTTFKRGIGGIWFAKEYDTEITGDVTLTGTNGSTSSRSGFTVYDDNTSSWSAALYSNDPINATNPAVPDLPAPAIYSQACVSLTYTMRIPNKDTDCTFDISYHFDI